MNISRNSRKPGIILYNRGMISKKRADSQPRLLVSGRKEILLLLGILLLGVVLRLSYLAELRHTPEYRFPSIDSAYHEYWARGLATGRWFVTGGREDPQVNHHPYYRPPGYAFFLSGIYRISGVGPLLPRLYQMFLGLGSVVLAWNLGRRWFGFWAGLLAATGLSIYWAFIYFEGELVGVSLTVFLVLLELFLLDKARSRGFSFGFYAGLTGAMLMLLRPNILPVLILSALWLVFSGRSRSWGLRVGAVFMGAVLLAPLGTLIRNYKVSGEWVTTATNIGISLGVANNRYSDGTTHVIPGLGDVGTPFDWPSLVRKMERLRGFAPGSLSHTRAASFLVNQARDWILDNPGKFIWLLSRKFLLFWGPQEVRNIREIHFARQESPTLSNIPGGFPVPALLGIMGSLWVLVVVRRCRNRDPGPWRAGILLLIFLWGYMVTLLPFAAAARYRVPVIPIMFLLGGAWLEGLVVFFPRRSFWGWLAVSVAVLVFLLTNFTGYQPSPEKWHYDRALAWTDAGEFDFAAADFEAALRYKPDFYRAANNLGNIEMFRRNFSAAEKRYRDVLFHHPELARTRCNLGNAIYNQALILRPANSARSLEMIQESIKHYYRALQIRPDLVEALNNLGVALVRLGKLEDALIIYNRALQFRPGNISTLLNLGELHERKKDGASARNCYLEILKLVPSHPTARAKLDQLNSQSLPPKNPGD